MRGEVKSLRYLKIRITAIELSLPGAFSFSLLAVQVTAVKSVNLLAPQFPPLSNEGSDTLPAHLMGFLKGLSRS